MLVLSRVLGGRVEPFLNAAVAFDAEDVDRSIVRWATGATAEAVTGLTAVVAFLGRNELGAQVDPVLPFFFENERSDVYDVSLGVRWRFAAGGIVSANVILPLNREGLRADAVPAFNLEYAF
jgi:hypothetical protein